jgi:hypothetical protein
MRCRAGRASMVNRVMVNRSAPDLFLVRIMLNAGFIPAEQKSAAPSA